MKHGNKEITLICYPRTYFQLTGKRKKLCRQVTGSITLVSLHQCCTTLPGKYSRFPQTAWWLCIVFLMLPPGRLVHTYPQTATSRWRNQRWGRHRQILARPRPAQCSLWTLLSHASSLGEREDLGAEKNVTVNYIAQHFTAIYILLKSLNELIFTC